MKLLVIDADYNFNKLNEPVIRLYGKVVGGSEEEKDIVLHVLNFEPYIYLGNCGLNIFDLQKEVERISKGYVKRIEIVQRYLPMGYQVEKTSMLRLVLFSPKVVRDLRNLLKESIKEISDSSFYEADIVYRNRYLVDYDINGTDVIEFNEINKKIPNYGLNCNELYIVDKSEVKVLKDELISVEY